MDDLLTSYVAFYSDEREAEQLNALWSQTVRYFAHTAITFLILRLSQAIVKCKIQAPKV
jgi:hypothetical protein